MPLCVSDFIGYVFLLYLFTENSYDLAVLFHLADYHWDIWLNYNGISVCMYFQISSTYSAYCFVYDCICRYAVWEYVTQSLVFLYIDLFCCKFRVVQFWNVTWLTNELERLCLLQFLFQCLH